MTTLTVAPRRSALRERLAKDDLLREVLTDRCVTADTVEALRHHRSAPIARSLFRTSPGEAPGPDLLIEIAMNDAGRRQLRNEIAGRAWAASVGVRTPAVVAHDPDGTWMLGESGAPAQLDAAYVDAVLDQADLIARTRIMPQVSADTRSWDSSRLTKVARASLVAAGGLSVPLFLESRRAYHALPAVHAVHGDFYFLNVLRGTDGGPLVVDWEYLGRGPRYSDPLRMWASLPDPALRAHLVDRLLDQCGTVEDRVNVGVVARWMAVRQLGENLSSLRHRSQDSLAHARSVIPEALALADALGVR